MGAKEQKIFGTSVGIKYHHHQSQRRRSRGRNTRVAHSIGSLAVIQPQSRAQLPMQHDSRCERKAKNPQSRTNLLS